MSITSFNFLFFIATVLAIYYCLPRRAQNYWLLIVSYAFYITWAWQFSLILLVITAANFFLANASERKPSPARFYGLGLV
jgi:alginate O-acetyltransferase complex protein AlgI